MKTLKVTRSQYKALQVLSRKDINTIRKHPVYRFRGEGSAQGVPQGA